MSLIIATRDRPVVIVKLMDDYHIHLVFDYKLHDVADDAGTRNTFRNGLHGKVQHAARVLLQTALTCPNPLLRTVAAESLLIVERLYNERCGPGAFATETRLPTALTEQLPACKFEDWKIT